MRCIDENLISDIAHRILTSGRLKNASCYFYAHLGPFIYFHIFTAKLSLKRSFLLLTTNDSRGGCTMYTHTNVYTRAWDKRSVLCLKIDRLMLRILIRSIFLVFTAVNQMPVKNFDTRVYACIVVSRLFYVFFSCYALN